MPLIDSILAGMAGGMATEIGTKSLEPITSNLKDNHKIIIVFAVVFLLFLWFVLLPGGKKRRRRV